jgi:hypothetical protein
MPDVTIQLSSSKAFKHRRALIDEGTPGEIELKLVGDFAKLQVTTGPHLLTWFVEGVNDQTYHLEVNAKDPGDCIGDSTMAAGQDQGSCHFTA